MSNRRNRTTIRKGREQATLIRSFTVRAETLNEESRTVEAVLATEGRVVAMDARTWEPVEEILEMRGAELPDQVVLLDGHSSTIRRAQGEYSSIDEVRGSIRGLRIDGTQLVGTIHFSDDEPSVRAFAKVREGHVRDISVGVHPLATQVIQPNTTQRINGRIYTAGRRPLHVRTKWRPIEGSLVPIGADPAAKVRNLSLFTEFDAMNETLRAYLNSIGLAAEATDEEAAAFCRGLSGRQRVVAAVLEGSPSDAEGRRLQADTLRGLGIDPEDPTKAYTPPADPPAAPPADPPTTRQQPPASPAEPTDDERIQAAIRAERQRVATIRTLAADDVPHETVRQAVDEGWSTAEASERFLASIRGGRAPAVGGAPAIHVRGHDRDCTVRTLGLALAMGRGGLDPIAAQQHRVVDGLVRTVRGNQSEHEHLAERADAYTDMALVDVCREACRIDGITIPTNRPALIRAAMSGSALTAIFSTNVNAQVLAGYTDAADSSQGWTSTAEVANFQTNERAAMGKFGALTKHTRGGDAEHLDTSDSAEEYKIARYSGQFTVDEMDIIDDRFGAVEGLAPRDMGDTAAQIRPNLVYAILLANAALDADSITLFHSSHSNTATAALAAAALQTGVAAMAKQRIRTRPLNIRPRYLIVPQDLTFTADILLTSAERRDDTATANGTLNPLRNRSITPVSDDRIGVAGVVDPATGTAYVGTATKWFLAARPGENGAKTIEVGYLRGTGRAPQIRSSVLMQGQWGMNWDVNLDIGAKALDYRGLYYSAGTG